MSRVNESKRIKRSLKRSKRQRVKQDMSDLLEEVDCDDVDVVADKKEINFASASSEEIVLSNGECYEGSVKDPSRRNGRNTKRRGAYREIH